MCCLASGSRSTGPGLPGARESRAAPKPECHSHSLSTRIGGSYWSNTEYPVFAVDDEPDAPVVIGAWFAFGAVVAGGFAVVAAFGSAAGAGTAVAAGCLEHAAATPRSSAMAKRLLISPPILIQ
jgi:hypothetical protein